MGPQEGSEEDQVEDEEGGQAEATNHLLRATRTRKYDSTQPISSR